jgi:hypothetical protein
MSQPDQREEEIFEATLQMRADERAAYLEKTCGDDSALHRRVAVLLAAFERAGNFLNEPVVPGPAPVAQAGSQRRAVAGTRPALPEGAEGSGRLRPG